MDKNISNLLPSELLSEEVKSALEEAWNAKLEEVRQEAQKSAVLQVREEFARRYAEDKARLVQAADKMFTEAIAKHAEQTLAEQTALKEERKRLTQAVKEARTEYRNRTANHAKVLENLVMSRLKKEITELSEDQRDLAAQKVQLKQAQMEAQKVYAAKLREHVNILENFVMHKLHGELNEFAIDHRAVLEERAQLSKQINEAEANYQKKLTEHMDMLKGFVVKKLHEEMSQLKQERTRLAEHRVALTRQVRENRQQLAEHYGSRLTKLEGFVVKQLTREISEFETDKRQLAEERVRMMTEAKTQLNETKRQFIKRASALVESQINKQIKSEIVQLREDIQVARENNFGRRIFEAVAAEYMASYLSEGSQVKTLQNQLGTAVNQLNEAKKQIAERTRLLEAATRRTQLAEERAKRNKVMSELLAPLSKEKRAVMESMLETVKTERLTESFRKYLPAVMNSGISVKPAAQARQVLAESETPVVATAPAKPKTTVAVTGNRQNKLAESAQADEVVQATAEIVHLRRLAGLDK